MGSRLWEDRRAAKLVVKYLFLPVLAVAIVGGAMIGLPPRARTVEADDAMPVKPPPIDGKRAYKYLEEICKIGPRTAGSAANTRQRELVAEHFKKMGAVVKEQPFQAHDPMTRKPLVMKNLIGSWFPDRTQRVVIGAHYDTRPHPDQEDDPARLKLPFIGANDGASGVALLMEIAHHLKDLETPWGVDLVLFDGEELVYGNNPRVGEYFLGSEEFARRYDAQLSKRTKMRYHAGFVLDMVGGKELQIDQEPYSLNQAPNLMREVWGVARNLDARSFRVREGREVMDDHLALNRAGIPTIDLIDFNYQFWHKADDLPENCSAESLAEVGRVVTGWLMIPRKRVR
jgi:glutaminyl-peptide cyclotransferase